MDKLVFGFYAFVNQNFDMWDIKIYFNDELKDFRADISTYVFGEDKTIQSNSLEVCLKKIVEHINYHHNFLNVASFINEAVKMIPIQIDMEGKSILDYLKKFSFNKTFIDARNTGVHYLIYYFTYLYHNRWLKSKSKFYKVRTYLHNHEYNI